MIKGGLTLLFCISLSYLTFAQKVGVQFYQGVNKSLITFSGDNGTLDYSSNFNSDTRLGVFFGDLQKISASTLFGASSVKAVAMNEDIVTTFTNSSLRIDIPVRYAFPKSFVSSVAVGPSVGLMMSSLNIVHGKYADGSAPTGESSWSYNSYNSTGGGGSIVSIRETRIQIPYNGVYYVRCRSKFCSSTTDTWAVGEYYYEIN